MITMTIAMMMSLSSGTMVIKMQGSKSFNKRRINAYYLASIKILGLVYVRR